MLGTPEITSVTFTVLANDKDEACSSFFKTGGIQDDKEDEKRRKHQAKRQKQPQPKNIRLSERIKRISLTPSAPTRRALCLWFKWEVIDSRRSSCWDHVRHEGDDGQKSVKWKEKCPS
ncbi:hypothetical protein METH109765_10335 [Mesobacillus thioparans]